MLSQQVAKRVILSDIKSFVGQLTYEEFIEMSNAMNEKVFECKHCHNQIPNTCRPRTYCNMMLRMSNVCGRCEPPTLPTANQEDGCNIC